MRQSTLRLTAPPVPDLLEAVHQERLFQMAALHEWKHPELAFLFAVPNGGYRAKATAAAMKRQGQKAGVPDCFLPVPRGPYHGLWIEMKRLRSGTMTEEQRLWQTFLLSQGYWAVLCRGTDAAWHEIMAYLALPQSPTGLSYNSI